MKTARSALPDAKPTDASVAGSAKVVGWTLVFWGAIQFAASAFEKNPTATVVAQAALAEWGASRMGIAWTDARATPGRASVLGRAGRGAGLGAAAALVAVVGDVGLGGASVAKTSPSLGL